MFGTFFMKKSLCIYRGWRVSLWSRLVEVFGAQLYMLVKLPIFRGIQYITTLNMVVGVTTIWNYAMLQLYTTFLILWPTKITLIVWSL
jgi:hypothetical protein